MSQRIKTRTLLFQLILIVFSVQGQQLQERIKSHTTYLASDKLEGRGRGSQGIKLASEYIANQFKTYGLKPGIGQSYAQKFSVPRQTTLESNIIGYIEAAEPSDKSIVFAAHYDAYGILGDSEHEDIIYNGARDNAVGVAALIELAKIFSNEKAPKHNVVFVAMAAEEFGLFGSKFYVNNPVFPSKEIIICLNIDGFNVSGIREDYFLLPRQGINFVAKIESIVKPMGWHYNSPDWVDGLNKNFDTASFLSHKIPAITLWAGNRLKGGEIAPPIAFGAIHTPEDEITENWNWNGVEEHLLLYKVIADYFLENPEGLEVTNSKIFAQK